ncbi:ABC transporter permease [Thalassobacillus sp. CUG 92003]|uniref:putative ABC transporter permease subunit n=1 Tax=Thalassobacillus sp. CUG 92003 TaxID=2736641 RepID=UPI0015E6330A|nr:ABC transporter permease [Thalassobacillus sp. CUG 92003]
MRNSVTLIRTLLKMQFSMVGKSTSEQVGMAIAILFAIPFAGLILSIMNSLIGGLYQQLAPTGNENAVLGLVFIALTVIFLFIGLTSILSSFYFAENIEALLSFPFHPYQIILGKSAFPMILIYIANAAILAPLLIFYGLHSGAGLLYYFYALIIWGIFPLVPFAVIAILLMFLMRFANISKNKDRTKVLAGLFSFVMIIGVNIVIRMNNDGQSTGQIATLIQEENKLLNMLTGAFPTAYFSSISLTQPASWTGLLYLFIMIAISVGAVILFLTFGQKLYFKGVLGLSGGHKKTFNEQKVLRKVKEQRVFLTLLKKELRIIFRTPTFFTQCIVQSLFAPVFLVVILLFERSGSISSVGTMLEQFNGKTTILILFLFSCLIVALNPTAVSSVSRDGKSWALYLYVPVDRSSVLLSKITAAWVISLLPIGIIAGFALISIDLQLGIWVAWLMITLIASWFTCLVGTILDMQNPKLDWTDEQEIFKRMMAFFALILEATVIGLTTLLIWLIPIINGIWLTTLMLVITMGVLITAGHTLLLTFIKKTA